MRHQRAQNRSKLANKSVVKSLTDGLRKPIKPVDEVGVVFGSPICSTKDFSEDRRRKQRRKKCRK